MFPIATWIAAVIGLLSVRAAPRNRDGSALDVRLWRDQHGRRLLAPELGRNEVNHG